MICRHFGEKTKYDLFAPSQNVTKANHKMVSDYEKRMICQDDVVVVRIMLKIVLTVQDAANELANELLQPICYLFQQENVFRTWLEPAPYPRQVQRPGTPQGLGHTSGSSGKLHLPTSRIWSSLALCNSAYEAENFI